MRFFKSKAFKALEQGVAANLASNFVRWVEHRGEILTHASLNYYLGGFLGLAIAQSMTYGGDLREEEIPELMGMFEAAATMIAVHNRASGKIVSIDDFETMVNDARAALHAYGMNPVNAVASLCERNKKMMGVSVETMFAALGNAVRDIKQLWPGGAPFERPH